MWTLALTAVALQAPADPIPTILERVDAARPMADVERLVGFHTRHTLSETESDTHGIGAARRWLRSELEAISEQTGGRLEVREQRFEAKVLNQEAELVNVYGFLPGTEVGPLGRTYVVSGHYDSRVRNGADASSYAPGANDDASGTAVVLELARIMAADEYRANLVFLLVPGEEQGLFGAKHFANQASEQGWDIDGMYTNDIVGGVEGGNGVRDTATIRCYSEADGLHSESRELARALVASAERYVPDANAKLVFRRDRFGRGGDHSAFHAAGFPALRLTEANEHYARQHKAVEVKEGVQFGDLPEYVSPEYMARVTRVNAAALAELSLAPPPPTRVRMRAAVSYDTQLGWAPSTEGALESGSEAGEAPTAQPADVGHYEIVWRDTTDPTWMNLKEIEAKTREQKLRDGSTRSVVQGTVEGVSADTNFFGVRAVSKAGHRSRVVLPRRP